MRDTKVNRLYSAIIALIFSALCSGQVSAADRAALVIGNGAYQNGDALTNPPNDARAVAQALRAIGFEVDIGVDLGKAQMEGKIRDFLNKAETAKIALLFYAGHGMQDRGKNYLLPVDAKLEKSSDLDFNTIEVDKILDNLNDSLRTTIIILDACRNNAQVRSFASRTAASRASVGAPTAFVPYAEVGSGTLIAYSTAPGRVALDGAGNNSPYTEALLQHINTPGLELQQMLRRVRASVVAATNNRQTPWENSSLTTDIYLAGPPSGQRPPVLATPATPTVAPPTVAPVARPSPNTRYSYVTGLDATGDNFLALRSEPSTEQGIRLLKMGSDTLLEVTSSQGSWRRVRLRSGQTGWAYGKYIACCKEMSDQPAQMPGAGKFSYVAGLDPNGDNWLALRATPTDRADNLLRKMPPETPLNVVGRQGDWLQVRLQSGETGWAFYRFVACCK